MIFKILVPWRNKAALFLAQQTDCAHPRWPKYVRQADLVVKQKSLELPKEW